MCLGPAHFKLKSAHLSMLFSLAARDCLGCRCMGPDCIHEESSEALRGLFGSVPEVCCCAVSALAALLFQSVAEEVEASCSVAGS